MSNPVAGRRPRSDWWTGAALPSQAPVPAQRRPPFRQVPAQPVPEVSNRPAARRPCSGRKSANPPQPWRVAAAAVRAPSWLAAAALVMALVSQESMAKPQRLAGREEPSPAAARKPCWRRPAEDVPGASAARPAEGLPSPSPAQAGLEASSRPAERRPCWDRRRAVSPRQGLAPAALQAPRRPAGQEEPSLAAARRPCWRLSVAVPPRPVPGAAVARLQKAAAAP